MSSSQKTFDGERSKVGVSGRRLAPSEFITYRRETLQVLSFWSEPV
ncbi:MAG: hypothetical protein LC795_17015 [Acidobacteria bacterium]|nr:hypothetical protein [Acidobacteriota bacterium]